MSRTWLGQKFLEAMEALADDGRLARGRSYARDHRLKYLEIDGSLVIAQVRGEEPTYNTVIDFETIY